MYEFDCDEVVVGDDSGGWMGLLYIECFYVVFDSGCWVGKLMYCDFVVVVSMFK